MPDLAPLSLGPLVLNGERALVALAVLAAVVVAEIQGRRRGRSADWSWSAVAIGLLAARVGWIVAHPQAYLARPLEVFYVWQGGFLGWAGVAAALIWAWWRLGRADGARRDLTLPSLVALVVAATALVALPVQPERPSVDAWDVRIERLDGASVAVGDWPGTPTVVNLWATWCPPCRRELPMLVEVAGDRSDVRLALVSQGEPPPVVRAYLDEVELPARDVHVDPLRSLGTAVALSGYPTTLFVDAEGAVQEVFVGELSRAALLRGMASIGVAARESAAP